VHFPSCSDSWSQLIFLGSFGMSCVI
jgi:hypothetical protein